MKWTKAAIVAATLAAAVNGGPAKAHGVAGARVFVTTLLVDDPNVADEASLPTVSYLPQGGGGGPNNNTWTISGEIDKTITETFGFAANYGYTIIKNSGAKNQTGFSDLVVTPKLKVYVNAEHEFMASVGVINEFGSTGNTSAGFDAHGYSQPNVYFGKGLGDLPIGPLRAFGITGEFGYAISYKELKSTTLTDPDTGQMSQILNTGHENRWAGGLTLQYSLEYLRAQVKDYGFGETINRITPLLELTWSSPATKPSLQPPLYLIGAGAVYGGDWYQVGAELLIPANKATGRGLGFITQFHMYFDDLFPNSLGKPLVQW